MTRPVCTGLVFYFCSGFFVSAALKKAKIEDKTDMLKRIALFLFAAVTLPGAPPAAAPQPVFIVLYTRFYDHSHPFPNNARIQRLIPLLDSLRAKYPDSGISSLLEFSGSMSQVFFEQNGSQHVVDKVKEAARRGSVEIGYTGEEEPSYLYRPKPDLLSAYTPEKRWIAQAEAAEHFLNDFKDPVTGRPTAGLTGGLKLMQDIFGPAAFIRGVSELVAGDSAATHEVHRLNATAMMLGVPPSDTRRGIEGYGSSADAFARGVSPVPNTSPEVFWEDGALRLSSVSRPDNRPHSTDDPLDILKKAFLGLDRSRVRVIALEVESYQRYLAKRADGSVLYDPMEWLYFHPDNPQFPPTMKPFVVERDIAAADKRSDAVLNWLLQEYLPANPGSRFLSIHDLVKMAGPESPAEVTGDQIKLLASDFETRFKPYPTRMIDYLRAGDEYFSAAQAFAVMAESLASADKTGSPLQTVRMRPVNGPIVVPNDMGPVKGTVTVRDVMHAAARVAPPLRETEWKEIPDNAIPPYVQTGPWHLNAAQFMRLMALTLLDPSPDRVLSISPMVLHSDLMFRYPKNTPIPDQGMGWTLKPAPLHFAGAAAAGQ